MGKRRGGGRGGGEGGGGGGGGGREDQYGGFGSQDRDETFQFSQKSSSGGGSAGGSRPGAGANLTFQRHVPKFLQKYSHLLGSKGQRQQEEDDPVVANENDAEDDDADENVEADALRRAMAENPELAKEFEGKLNKRLNQAQASEEKERGNRLFADKKYQEAIKSFTKCIELDPDCEIYYSNRSAAYASIEDWQSALSDAKRAVALKPRWVKGFSRLATAYFGLKLYSDAKEAYEKALKLEPDDQALQKSLQKAEIMELQHIRENKHVFKKMKTDPGSKSGQPGQQPHKQQRDKAKLSFAEDEQGDV